MPQVIGYETDHTAGPLAHFVEAAIDLQAMIEAQESGSEVHALLCVYKAGVFTHIESVAKLPTEVATESYGVVRVEKGLNNRVRLSYA